MKGLDTMPRGGARAGAGRPKAEKERTKATIYKEDRDLLNSIAQSHGYSVHELLHIILHSDKLPMLLNQDR